MKKIILMLLLLQTAFVTMQAQSNESQVASQKATEWVAVKESAMDSVTLAYLQANGWIQYEAPRNENNNVFFSVSKYLASLLDETLSAVSRNANAFYDTPVGFWATWGVFYQYTGAECLEFLREIVFLLIITGLFIYGWRRWGIAKAVPDEAYRTAVKRAPGTEVSYEIQKVSANNQFWLLSLYCVLSIVVSVLLSY